MDGRSSFLDRPLSLSRSPRGWRRMRLPRGLIFILPLLVFLVVTFGVPLVGIVLRSLGSSEGVSLKYFDEVFQTQGYWKILLNTFRVSALVTLMTCLIGYPLAYWISRLNRTAQIIAITLVILPFWTSVLVRTYSWIIILGNRGLINETLLKLGVIDEPMSLVFNETGVSIGMIHVLMPFLVLPLLAVMIGVDRRLVLVAKSLGARPWFAFWKIYFPLTLPALAAGGILVLILSLGFYVTPALLGGGKVPMIATVLDTLINRLPRWEIASALSIILLGCSLVLFALYRRLDGVFK